MSEKDQPRLRPDPRLDVVLDAKGLRALAHPVRVQLVWLLRKYGPSTATRLAERMGLTSGATSYHLRQLGTAGFVEEDTGRGSARERWWRAAHRGTWLTDMDLLSQDPEAGLAYLQSIAAVNVLQTQQALNEFQTLPHAWRDVFDLSDWSLRLSPGEAQNLLDDLSAVLARYRPDRPEEAATAPEDAERVTLVLHLLPEPGLPAGGSAPEAAGDDGGPAREKP
ncbi:helix-turn-helix domain-containing protein [Actinoallomurus oryzae]|uniref:Helix-turn-helix domain-containing protein n=1 Tax=Actinoallomurus oryzae TaxID=502180 RepID=A0ABP8Q9W0_9ACTN